MTNENKIIQPIVISTFAGCGGSSLGYEMAGFKELLATDWDKNSVETLKLNFPNTKILAEDITKLSVERILKLTGIKPGELDILDGSPPCQGFSMAGDRQVSDPRNKLFLAFIDILRGLKPKAFVMENVQGITYGKMRGVFNTILEELKNSGYEVSAQVCNAADYGVAQSRKRLFFVGIRKDVNKKFIFPQPTTPQHLSTYQVLKDLVITEKIETPGPAVTKRFAKVASEGESGAKYNRGSFFNWHRISRFAPSRTITKTAYLLHWSEDRFLTIQELKRLCGFPDDFKFTGTHREQWARIGNAVMPPLMLIIAKEIKETLYG